jgi:YHS domain-containing protein
VSLLRWWIEIGAPTNKTIASLKPPVSVMRNLQARFTPSVKTGALARIAPPPDLKTLQPLIQQLTEELGITFEPLAPADPWLQCNASIAGSAFGDTELARLTPLAANIRWLDLGGTQVTDAGLPTLMRMTNLTRLHLERTKLTDAGLAKLAALNELEYLNLYGTEISDAGIENLQGLPKLRQLYLWRTKVSPAAAATFKDSRIDQDQIQRWQEEIAQLEKKIQGEQFALELGITTNSPSSKPVAAINTMCPVSGKAIDPTKTVVHEGRVIAFCCDDCKAQFEKDPKAFTSKLPATEVKAAAKSN